MKIKNRKTNSNLKLNKNVQFNLSQFNIYIIIMNLYIISK